MHPAASGLLTLAFLTVGCAVRGPQTYRLIAHDKSSVLIPPGVSGPDVSRRVFTAEVAPGPGTCPADSDAVKVRPKGHRLRLTLNRDTLVRQPPGWLSAWTAAAEARNCVASGQGLPLGSRILEALPMDPIFGYGLLHPSYRQSGYVDLGPEIRLEVNSPITRDGAPPIESSRIEGLTVEVKTSAGLLGFEKAWYAVRPKPGGAAGNEIVPLSAERHIAGTTEAAAEPARNYFLFPPDTGFYRLFYKTDQGTTRIVVAGARTRADLDRATQAAGSAADTCKSFEERRCVFLPQHVAANPDVVAIVNGREIPLPVGSNVGTAIQAAGEKDAHRILPQLRVRRLYGGKLLAVEFDRSSQEILALPLFGGEEISWR